MANLTPDMQTFCALNPTLATTAITRDAQARVFFGNARYALYQQGSLQVIDRRTRAAASGVPASFSGMNGHHCNVCGENKSDIARHQQDVHIKDPTKMFFCPCATNNVACDKSMTRGTPIEFDEHLANAHLDFRNTSGRGGELLERSVEEKCLKRLNTTAMRHVAVHRGNQLISVNQDIMALLKASKDAHFAYTGLDLGVEVLDDDQLDLSDLPDISIMNMKQAMDYAILVRQKLMCNKGPEFWGKMRKEVERIQALVEEKERHEAEEGEQEL